MLVQAKPDTSSIGITTHGVCTSASATRVSAWYTVELARIVSAVKRLRIFGSCHAGLFIADPTFSRKVNASIVHGDMCPRNVSTAKTATLTSIHICQKISSRRRSKMSAVAPASSPSSSTGRLATVCINAISSGLAVNTVISHVPAVSCIHVPTEEIVDAIHRSRNKAIPSGANPVSRLGFATGPSEATPVSGSIRGIPKVYGTWTDILCR